MCCSVEEVEQKVQGLYRRRRGKLRDWSSRSDGSGLAHLRNSSLSKLDILVIRSVVASVDLVRTAEPDNRLARRVLISCFARAHDNKVSTEAKS